MGMQYHIDDSTYHHYVMGILSANASQLDDPTYHQLNDLPHRFPLTYHTFKSTVHHCTLHISDDTIYQVINL